jgi:O-acetyl-ADP-ribose deacetylase (regulator of RNase III)
MPKIQLQDYTAAIHLQDKFSPLPNAVNDKAELVDELLAVFIRDNGHAGSIELPADYAEKRKLLRGLLTVRGPEPITAQYQEMLDSLLQTELIERGEVQAEQLEAVSARFPGTPFESAEQLSLWQGDITRLNADAIVNAANKYMLGCFQPGHACIDNAIHSAAGPRLRDDCNTIMSLQGGDEITGGAKITRGYNLPAAYVIHTVGPIVPAGTPLQELHRLQLASCYHSCLELANAVADIRTIAFCAISTGVFGFPKPEAARIAVKTVDEWLVKNPSHHFDKLIFNVFSAEDYSEYAAVF